MAWQYHLTGWRKVPDPDTGDVWVPDIPEMETFGAIDLRPTKALSGSAGFCLVATPEIVTGFAATAIKFGVSPGDPVPDSVVRALGNRLGLTFAGGSVKELLYELLKTQGDDADPNKWNSIKPTAGRKGDNWKRYEEIHLGEMIERRFHSENVPGANTIIMNDQFTHLASGERIASGEGPDTVNTPANNWDDCQHDWQGDGSNNAENNTADNASYSQIDTGDASIKVMIEVEATGASALNFYASARQANLTASQSQDSQTGFRFTRNGTNFRIQRKDGSGAPTTLATDTSTSYSVATKYVLGGRLSGSTLVGFWETPFTTSPADIFSTTDSNYSAQTYAGAGIFGGANPQEHRWSQFIIDDDPSASGGGVTIIPGGLQQAGRGFSGHYAGRLGQAIE